MNDIFSFEQLKKIKLKKGTSDQKDKIDARITQLKEKYRKMLSLKNDYPSDLPFVGSAFVTFYDEAEKNRFHSNYIDKISRMGNPITFKVHHAALPSDISWENYEEKKSSDVLKQALFALLVCFIIFLSFSNLLFIEYLGDELAHFFQGFESDFVGLLSSVGVVAVNHLLKASLNWSTTIQKIPIFSDSLVSKIKKEVISQFINTSLLLLLINVFYYKKFQIVGEGKLLQTIFFFLTIDFLLELLIFAIDIKHQKKAFFTRRLESERAKTNKKVKLFQYEINMVFEREDFEIAESLTSLFNIFGIAAFYHPIFPFGMALVSIRLIFLYLMTKYEFTKRSKIPRELEFRFFGKIIDFSDIFLYQFVLGYLVFDLILVGIPSLFTIAMLLLLIAFVIYRFKTRKNQPRKIRNSDDRNLVYSQSQNKLYSDYDLANPVLKNQLINFDIEEEQNNEPIDDSFDKLLNQNKAKMDQMKVKPTVSDKMTKKSMNRIDKSDINQIGKSYFRDVSQVLFMKNKQKVNKSQFISDQSALKSPWIDDNL